MNAITPDYPLLSGVDQQQLQREFKQAFPPKKGTLLRLLEQTMKRLEPRIKEIMYDVIKKSINKTLHDNRTTKATTY